MTVPCPVCAADTDDGLLCPTCILRLEQTLRAIPELVRELDVTLSRQSRLGTPAKGGLAREKTPIHFGAAAAAWELEKALTPWAATLSGKPVATTTHAAHLLLLHIDAVRRHPEVKTLTVQISEAVTEGWREVDRAADRVFVGPCDHDTTDEYGDTTKCSADLYAKPQSATVRCRTCGNETDVADQQGKLLDKSKDMLFTAREAARLVGNIAGRNITEDQIRGYIRRERITLRPGTKTFRLGDLLDLLAGKVTA